MGHGGALETHPETAEPLRPHADRNREPHEAFLREYGLHRWETKEVIDRFHTLPVLQEVQGRGACLCRDGRVGT